METVLLARRMNVWYDRLVERIRSGDTKTFNGDKWEPATWPAKSQGYGYLDAPRGALGHWVQIENGKISRYQCVVPSTWNCSPRDAQGQMGPYEAALVDNHPLLKPEQPLEILRTIHSFDPCMACGVHVLDADGQPDHRGHGPMTARAGRRATAPRDASLGAQGAAASGEYRWVYLWGWPIRAMHWLAALSHRGAAGTGLYIGRPYFVTSGDTSAHYLMGWIRFLHFAAAGVLVATAIVRVYWLFAGNKFERWVALFPVRPRDWVNMLKQVKYYLMIQPEKAPHYLGHNPLQQLSYTGGLRPGPAAGGHRLRALRAVQSRRLLLHGLRLDRSAARRACRSCASSTTWPPGCFLTFIPIHVYLATRADLLERGGAISSIISGGRFVPSGQHFIDE